MESKENSQNSNKNPNTSAQFGELETNPRNLDDEQVKALLPEEIDRLLSPLDDREREVIRFRFALGGEGEVRTYEQVGEHLKISSEMVQQIESQAMSKLRHPSPREI